MSPLWRDQIRVFFAPERVDLVRLGRGMKPEQIARLSAFCEPAPDSPGWSPPLQKLEQMLAETAGTEMTVTLSNHFVRYTVIPAQIKIADPVELNAYAVFHMREVYGERAAAWVLGVSSWDPCSGAICAAIDRGLLEQLQELAARHKIKLRNIEPYLTAAFDQWCASFNGERMWFALIEAGRICLASLADGSWQRIVNQKILNNTGEELLAILDQEAMLFSAHKEAVEQVHLFAPEHPDCRLPDDCGWRIVPLQSADTPAPAHFPTPVRVTDKVSGSCAA